MYLMVHQILDTLHDCFLDKMLDNPQLFCPVSCLIFSSCSQCFGSRCSYQKKKKIVFLWLQYTLNQYILSNQKKKIKPPQTKKPYDNI